MSQLNESLILCAYGQVDLILQGLLPLKLQQRKKETLGLA